MLILLFLLVGAFVGWLLPRWPRLLRGNHHATNGAIYLLVFLLGVSIGGNETIRAALPQLGGQAAWLSLGALLGSLLLSQLVYFFVLRERTAVTTPAVKSGIHLSAFLGSLIILLFFVSGMAVSWWGWLPAQAQDERLTLATLYLLLFLVGVGLGGGSQLGRILRRVQPKILLIPLAVALGSLLGAGLFSLWLPDVDLAEGTAVGAGLGYYSLSSVLISQLRGESLGVIALLSNIIREIATLLLAPLLARYLGRLAPVAAGGATAMDTTLPIIVQVSGEEYGVMAIVSGVLLTTAVPVLVTLLLR
jgi:uncharacterized membrane protein YbjE (DUF340 family)